MTPTPEQAAIILAAQTTQDNLLISALAGAAKTSTLELIANALPDTEILCLAFNKRNADEMQKRLPPNCTAKTLNALGHRVWSEATGRRLRIEPSKTYTILTELISKLDPSERSYAFERFGDLLRTIDFGKTCGYIPTGHYEKAKRLMDDEEFFAHLEEHLTPLEEELVREATLASLKQSFEGLCDYNDQILMPTVFHGAFPRYPLILVDEVQDLSALNHAMLAKLVKKRVICVGDACQSIYGFRGAHEESMELLREQFSMRELALSISFRCPIAVIEHARWRAPHMQWPEWAKPGTVTTLTEWSEASIPDNSSIICRNNAPLFSLAIKLLKAGRYAELVGNDIGKNLLKILKKFGKSTLSKQSLLNKIAEWEEVQIKKTKKRGHNGVRDRAECLRIFAMAGDNLGDSLAFAEHVFNSRGPLKLMTGHKSKGMEYDHIFFLDEHLVGDEPQERNLRYVIQTRAKQTLTYITSDGYQS